MERTYLAVVTATSDNIAFRIEVSNIGTIVLERSINGTKWVIDREISDVLSVMFPAQTLLNNNAT